MGCKIIDDYVSCYNLVGSDTFGEHEESFKEYLRSKYTTRDELDKDLYSVGDRVIQYTEDIPPKAIVKMMTENGWQLINEYELSASTSCTMDTSVDDRVISDISAKVRTAPVKILTHCAACGAPLDVNEYAIDSGVCKCNYCESFTSINVYE